MFPLPGIGPTGASSIKSIQRGSVATASATTGNIAISKVDMAKTVVFNTSNGPNAFDFVGVYISDPTTLVWSKGGTNNGTFYWQAVEFA